VIRKKRTPLHLSYAEAVATGEMRPPRAEVEHLVYGVKAITAEAHSPFILETRILAGVGIKAHRYLLRAPRDLSDTENREFHARGERDTSWVPGPPPFVVAARVKAEGTHG